MQCGKVQWVSFSVLISDAVSCIVVERGTCSKVFCGKMNVKCNALW